MIMKKLILITLLSACAFLSNTWAQIPYALDITCSIGLFDEAGNTLPGNNPHIGAGYVAGDLVQLIDTGGNGLIDLPTTDGNPGGDDSLIAQSHIGKGMLAIFAASGRFSFSVLPAPAEGTRCYVRAFNHHDLSSATGWGQSAIHVVKKGHSLDVSQLGLAMTAIPKGVDITTADSDGDGQKDIDELIANTNALEAGDEFSTPLVAPDGSAEFFAEAGRSYRLLRSASLSPADWQEVDNSGVLSTSQSLTLNDGTEQEDTVFYRLEVDYSELN